MKIGCASAFWGDTSTALPQLVKENLDYIVFDYLAEVTMSILAGAKLKNPELGYATDFVKSLGPSLKEIKEKKIKLISNAGGINVESCQKAIKEVALKAGVDLKVAIVKGDDLLGKEIETKLPEGLLSVNAYLGAPGIKKALEEGADIVITGRCVDSALVLGPLMYEFGWGEKDYDLLASGSLAGHIIECGAHCTGGNFTDWHLVPDFHDMGFPIVEVESNGEFVVTKPEGTGGLVCRGSVGEQLLYEIDNPSAYILPDVVCDFTQVTLEEVGKDRVLVKGAKGLPPTDTYKVSATYVKGFRLAASVVLGGMEAEKKSAIAAESIYKKTRGMFEKKGWADYTEAKFDVLGTESIYGHKARSLKPREVVLRLVANHKQKEALVLLSKEIAQAATGTVPGIMNFLGGRPSVSPSIRLFSFMIPKKEVEAFVSMEGSQSKVEVSFESGFVLKETPEKEFPEVATEEEVPLIKLAYARSGDKGDNANIGVISRRPEYLPYIRASLKPEVVADYFSSFLKGSVKRWELPGIGGFNFLLTNVLGGGGMSSLHLDPQGKAFAQQLLEIPIKVPKDFLRSSNASQ